MSQLTALCTSECDGKRNGDCEFAHYCGWFFFAFPTVCLPADNVPEVVATIAKYERAREPLTASPNTHVFISRAPKQCESICVNSLVAFRCSGVMMVAV